MKRDDGSFWLLSAFSVFIIGLAIWVLAVLHVSIATAAPFGYRLDLRSQLYSDYKSDQLAQPIRILRLSIVREVLQDLGLSDDSIEARIASGQLDLEELVPTATALNFSGDDPPTVTPIPTSTSKPAATKTLEPTRASEPSKTPKSPKPSKTPGPSKTPKASKTPEPSKTPTASDTPETPIDLEPPEIIIKEEFIIAPEDGSNFESCEFNIDIDKVYVSDPKPSSGLDWIKIKYEIEGHTGLIYSDPLDIFCGGMNGDGSWYSGHRGSVEVEIEEDWEDPVTINVWLKAKDNAGNCDIQSVATYTVTCEDD